MTNLQKTINHAIPVYFNEDDFNKFILPHLWSGSRGPKTKLPLWKVFHYILHILYTGEQWKMLPIENGPDGKPEIHYCRIWMKWKQWVEHGSIAALFYQSVRLLKERGHLDLSVLHGDGSNSISVKGGDLKGYCGHKHQKGNKIVSLQDNCGNILAPMTIVTVSQSDMLQFPDSLSDLKTTCERSNLTIPKRTPLNLDPGLDSQKNRKKPKRGRKRFFDKELYAQRYKCERTFAWQDKFRRVLVQYEWYQHLFLGFNLLAFTLINLRHVH